MDSGNHYVIQVKANQKTLFREIQRVIVENEPLDYYEEHEKNHGRHSSWFVRVFDAQMSIKTKEWKNLRRFIHVHKRTIHKGGVSDNCRLYISDLFETDAQFHHTGIRGHWKIENSLHWVKDVVHKEDANRLKLGNAPLNAATFSSFAINIHRANGNHSISHGQIKFGTNVRELFQLLRT